MKRAKRKPNYQALFVIGVALMPIGLATANPGLMSAGLVFFLIGLSQRKKGHDQ